jgi:hypothetical protein
MQESHAAALRARSEAMQPSIADAPAIARRDKATAKQAKEDFKAALKGLKADVNHDVKSAVKQAGRRG